MDKIQVEYNQETGKLQIDLSDLFSSMSDEESTEFVDKYALWYPVMEQLVYELRNGFSGENYNSVIYKLRQAILGNKDLFESMFAEQIIDMLEVVALAKLEEKRWKDAYWKLWHYISDKDRYRDERDFYKIAEPEKFKSISFGSDNKDIKEFIEWLKKEIK